MANLTPQQRQAADSMISGSFDAVGARPQYLSPETSVADMYRNIITMPSWGAPNPNIGNNGQVGSPYMTAQERQLLQQQIAASKQLQSAPAAQPIRTADLFQPPLPRPRPGNAPSRMDTAAINAIDGAFGRVPSTPAELMAYNEREARRMTVPPKSAAPSAGKSLSSMFVPPPPSTIRGSSTGRELEIGKTYSGTNGYQYTVMPDGTIKQLGVPVGGGAAAYAARVGGAGSVAEMERLHSGASRAPQSGGPASGGEYGGGGGGDGNSWGTPGIKYGR